jgi:hypothetical protein
MFIIVSLDFRVFARVSSAETLAETGVSGFGGVSA